MKHWKRLLAALMAALLGCALPLAALAESVIEGDDGLSLELESEALEIEDGLGLDAALPEIELTAPAAIVADLAPLTNAGEEGENPGETEEEDDGFDIENSVVVGYHGAGSDITTPERAAAIGEWSFYEFPLATSVTIPGNVEDIGEGCFQFCPNLTRVTIEEGATAIRHVAFAGCPKLVEVTIPGSVKLIEGLAFAECGALKKLTLGEGIEDIDGNAFMKCTVLTKVTIPAKVKTIVENPFEWCVKLQKIDVASGNKTFTASDGMVYTKDMKTLRCCPSGKATVNIAEGVTSIGEEAFAGCVKLESIVIPKGVKTIDNVAFYECTSLKRVTIPASMTRTGDGAFRYEGDGDDFPLKVTFIVEDGSYAQKFAKQEGYAVLIDLSKAKVTIADQVYTGKALKPAVKVVLNKKTLKAGKDYAVAYKANKAVGTATVTVTGVGSYAGTATGTFDIIPKPVAELKLEAGVKRLTASWKKGKGITGYQFQYSLKKSFASSKKVNISEADTVSRVIKGLQSGKTYYVRIRAYGKVDGKTYWSDAQSVNVK